MNTPTRIIIADDYHCVREGVEGYISRLPQFMIVATVASFAELLYELEAQRVDVIVLDLEGMGAPPLGMIARLRMHYPYIKIVVYADRFMDIELLLEAGVHGYIHKWESMEQISTAIRTIIAGREYLSPRTQELLAVTTREAVRHNLTPRELSILQCLAAGLGTKEIAERYDRNIKTIQNQINFLLKKKNCSSRSELIVWYHHTIQPLAQERERVA